MLDLSVGCPNAELFVGSVHGKQIFFPVLRAGEAKEEEAGEEKAEEQAEAEGEEEVVEAAEEEEGEGRNEVGGRTRRRRSNLLRSRAINCCVSPSNNAISVTFLTFTRTAPLGLEPKTLQLFAVRSNELL